MDRNKALQDIALIKRVMEKTNIYYDNHYPYYMLWGTLVVAATSVQQYAQIIQTKSYWIYPLVWLTFMALGVIGSIVIASRTDRGQHNETAKYIGRINMLIWGSATLAIFILVLMSSVWNIYPIENIILFITLIIGLTLIFFGIYFHKPAVYLGLLCFPATIVMCCLPLWQPAIYGLLLGGGYFIIGLLNRARIRSNVNG